MHFIISILKLVCMPMHPYCEDFRWSYTSEWWCHCPDPLVWYKEHSSSGHFQQKSSDTSYTMSWTKCTEIPHGCAEIFWFLISRNSGTTWSKKGSFQSHIVEQHKSYRMVVESWESVLNIPLFVSACEQHAQNHSLWSSWTSLGYRTWTRRKNSCSIFWSVFGVLEVNNELDRTGRGGASKISFVRPWRITRTPIIMSESNTHEQSITLTGHSFLKA